MIPEYERILNDCITELNEIESWIDSNKLHSNVRYLVSYSIMKSSGSIEVVFKQMISDFLGESVKTETENYLTVNIVDSSCNPNTGNMGRLLQQADPSRKNSFDNLLKDPANSQNKVDLNALVQLRNDLAHGRTTTASIGIVKRYFEAGVAVVRILESVLYPS